MSVSNLIDFFDQEIEATNELRSHLELLRNAMCSIQVNDGPFVLFTRALEHVDKLLELISATEQLRGHTDLD